MKDGTIKQFTRRLHDELGPFVRIGPNEVSVAHPDRPRKLLPSPLRKGVFYQHLAFPDSSYKSPISIRVPKEKMEPR
ncbi:hypothetical protein AB5N19_08656 [Seiridium cardinale]